MLSAMFFNPHFRAEAEYFKSQTQVSRAISRELVLYFLIWGE